MKMWFFALLSLIYCTLSAADDNEDFLKWFTDNGGRNTGVSVHSFPSMGRGVLATKDVFKGEEVLFIPNQILLARDLFVSSSDSLHRRIALALPSSEQAVVAVLLLEVFRGPKSKWAPYIKVLPKYIPNLSYFSEEMLDELHDNDLKVDALEHQQSVTSNYARFVTKVSSFWPGDFTVTLDEYRWATAIIDSRGLRFQGKVVLAPFADMFNYAPNHIVRESNHGTFFLEHHVRSKIGLTVSADHDCVGNTQLMEDYGDNIDTVYVTYHGFIPYDNPFRCIDVTLPSMLALGRRTREVMELLQFRKTPESCIAYPDAKAIGPKKPLLDTAFVAYVTLMAMERSELDSCASTVTAGSATKHDYWARVFRACGFDNTTELVARLVTQNTGAGEGSTECSDGQCSNPIIPAQSLESSSLAVRAVSLARTLLVNAVYTLYSNQISETPTAHSEETSREKLAKVRKAFEQDKALRTAVQVELEETAGALNRTKLHYELALNYRIGLRETWLKMISMMDLAAQDLLDQPRTLATEPAKEDTQVVNSSTMVEVTPTAVITTTTVTTQTVTTVSELTQQLNEFNDWVAAASPTAMKIKAVELPLPYRVGTVVTEDVAAEQVYLTVPMSIILDNEKARSDKVMGNLFRQLEERYKGSDEFHELLLYLIYEKVVVGENSHFYPYLRLLPTLEELGSPILWNEEQMKENLFPSHVYESVVDERRRALKTFEMISNIDLITRFFQKISPDMEVLTLDNYLWASAILNSRAIWWVGKRHLVPLLDFINCQEGPPGSRVHSTVLSANGREAVTKAAWSFENGQQLFENYGQPNHMYFTYHGFSLDSNSHDCVHTLLHFNQSELESFDWVKAKPYATRLGIRRTQQSATISVCLRPDPIPEKMWLFLALKMGTYTTAGRGRDIGGPSVLAANYLLDSLTRRAALYSQSSRQHAAAAAFLHSELVVLEAMKHHLAEYLKQN